MKTFQVHKLSAAAFFSLLVVAAVYFGSYLPFRKSRLYLETAADSAGLKTVKQFTSAFDEIFDFYSPVGQEETVAAYLETVIGLVQNQTDPGVTDILLRQAEARLQPFLKTGRGFSFPQNVYALGLAYELAGQKLQSADYYRKSIALYEKGRDYSPNRPLFLYGLFRTYYIAGNDAKVREVGEIILKLWPEDSEVKTILERIGS